MAYERKTWELALDDVGFPGLWVKLFEPRTQAVREQIRLQKAQAVLHRVAQSGKPISIEDEWSITAIFDLVAKLLVDWNVPQVETNQVLALTDDRAANAVAFEGVPTEIYDAIVLAVGQRMNAAPKRD